MGSKNGKLKVSMVEAIPWKVEHKAAKKESGIFIWVITLNQNNEI